MVMCDASPCYTRFLSVALSCVCVSHRDILKQGLNKTQQSLHRYSYPFALIL